jgi:hypothetical protein
MKLIAFILFLGLLSSDEILAQGHRKVDSQFDFGTTLAVPYKKTMAVGQNWKISYFSTKVNDRNGPFEHRGTISHSGIN